MSYVDVIYSISLSYVYIRMLVDIRVNPDNLYLDISIYICQYGCSFYSF